MELVDDEHVRLAKALVDAGKAADFSSAIEALRGLRFNISIAPDAAETVAGQMAIATAVATGVRTGGSIFVRDIPDVPTLIRLTRTRKSLRHALVHLGAKPGSEVLATSLHIGPANSAFVGVQTWIDGWWAGATDGRAPQAHGDLSNPLSGTFSGALAMAQAFRLASGAVRIIPSGLNLWHVGSLNGVGGSLEYLPSSLWAFGLGHLGQGFLWSLSALPYQRPSDCCVILQDYDASKKQNWGTSLLVARGNYGQLKTRYAMRWLESRGFRTILLERRADDRSFRDAQDPSIAVCGLDNLDARKWVGEMGFPLTVDAGLGRTHADYLSFALNVFSTDRPASPYWSDVKERDSARIAKLLELDAYKKLAPRGVDPKDDCGTALFAGRSVATSFVGAAVGALTTAQIVRAVSGAALPTQSRGSLGMLELFEPSPHLIAMPPLGFLSGKSPV